MTSPRKIEFFLPESRYIGGEKGFKGTQWVPINRNAFSGGVLFKKCVCLISPFQELCNKICAPTLTQQSHERASAGQGRGPRGRFKGSLASLRSLLSFFCFVFVLRQTGLELTDLCHQSWQRSFDMAELWLMHIFFFQSCHYIT